MGTQINLEYQVDGAQLDDHITTYLQSGDAADEVVNISGDRMTSELRTTGVNFNLADPNPDPGAAARVGVADGDTGLVYGTYSGINSILHVRFGNDANDKFQLEYYNGSVASNIILIDGNKDVNFADRNHTVTSTGTVTFDVTGDMLLDVDTAITLDCASTLTFNSADYISFKVDGDEKMRVHTNGDIGIGVTPTVNLDIVGELKIRGAARSAGVFYTGGTNPLSSNRMNYDGNFYATKIFNAVYNDLAEYFLIDGEAGVGLVYVASGAGKVKLSGKRADKAAVGICSDSAAFVMKEEYKDKGVLIALSGTVKALVRGKIKAGDVIVSYKNGEAIKANIFEKIFKHDAIIGKALESKTSKDTGNIIVVV